MSRFEFRAAGGPVLYFTDFEAAVAYYSEVLGEPEFTEGSGTCGWTIGSSHLTLLRGGDGAPQNTEVGFIMESASEADRLHAAFVIAGGRGEDPSDQVMYQPIRYCPVTDPFGTALLIYAPLADQSDLA